MTFCGTAQDKTPVSAVGVRVEQDRIYSAVEDSNQTVSPADGLFDRSSHTGINNVLVGLRGEDKIESEKWPINQ